MGAGADRSMYGRPSSGAYRTSESRLRRRRAASVGTASWLAGPAATRSREAARNLERLPTVTVPVDMGNGGGFGEETLIPGRTIFRIGRKNFFFFLFYFGILCLVVDVDGDSSGTNIRGGRAFRVRSGQHLPPPHPPSLRLQLGPWQIGRAERLAATAPHVAKGALRRLAGEQDVVGEEEEAPHRISKFDTLNADPPEDESRKMIERRV